mgnify:CR=1 FL=1
MCCGLVHCTPQTGVASHVCPWVCLLPSWQLRPPFGGIRLCLRFAPPPPPPRGSPATTPAARGRVGTCCKPRCQPRRSAVLSARLTAAAPAPARVLPARVSLPRCPRCRCVGRQCGHRSRRAAGALAPLRLAPWRVGCTRTPPLRPPAQPALSGCWQLNLMTITPNRCHDRRAAVGQKRLINHKPC